MNMKKIRRILAAVIVTLLAGSSAAMAQMAPSTSSHPPAAVGAPTPSAMPGAQEILGTVKTVDQEQERITLDDGTMLTFAPSAKNALAALKAGAKIQATYVEKDGKKVITSLRVEKSPKS
jgi:Cu/Ag efflux protein CusF